QRPLSQISPIYALISQGGGAAESASLELLAAVRSHDATTGLPTAQAYSWSAELLRNLIEEAGDIAPESRCRSTLNLAISAARLNQLGTAERAFRAADACLTGEDRAVLGVHWADTLARMNRGEDAIAKLRETLAGFPENLDVRLGLARSLKNFGF